MSQGKYSELRGYIDDPEYWNWEWLCIELINLHNLHEDNDFVQDLVLRLMERKEELSSSYKLIEHLVGELGLFPYLDEIGLGYKEKIRQILFSAPNSMNKVFHIKQAEVFHKLMSGENVALSAPTSFGKSLIIEAIVATYAFDNIVVVVPTIALIDELKKKLHKYSDNYKIVTQSNQKSAEKNLFIYTQERVIESDCINKVDFFVIDEFYKLAPSSDEDYRCDRLNLAFHKLHKHCQHFYMLGPNIEGISEGIEEILNCKLLKYDYFKTVSSNEYYYPINCFGTDKEKDIERDQHLATVLRDIGADEQTVIYCRSPKRANNLLARLLELDITRTGKSNLDLSAWLREMYHQDWNLAEGIKHGIACHHAKLPRSLGSLLVDLFNQSKINILICTSTLIEGVNTNAKNIIIYDDCLTKDQKLDTFTFNNISGRSGRMFKHYVGNVYIFGEKPQEELPFVDIPIVSQSENASDSVLLQISDELDAAGRNKIARYTKQTILPISLLNKHQGIPPERLLAFAEAFTDKCGKWHRLMKWTEAYPRKNQLDHLCMLMKEYFEVTRMGAGCIRSAKHLNRRIRDVMNQKSDKDMIIDEYNYRKSENQKYTVDDAVQVIFEFKRNLIGYNLPKIIFAINDIQKLIFERYDYVPGDYTSFAIHLESFFELPALSYLEEFGVPFHVSKKIMKDINLIEQDDVDDVIRKIKENRNLIEGNNLLSSFEYKILDRALRYV